MILCGGAVLAMCFDLLQLVVMERYIGPRVIRKGQHPVTLREPPTHWLSVGLLAGNVTMLGFNLLLLTHPDTAFQGLIVIFISSAGFSLRRVVGLKWGLVMMTLEGALRIGMMLNLLLTNLVFRDHPYFSWTRNWLN